MKKYWLKFAELESVKPDKEASITATPGPYTFCPPCNATAEPTGTVVFGKDHVATPDEELVGKLLMLPTFIMDSLKG